MGTLDHSLLDSSQASCAPVKVTFVLLMHFATMTYTQPKGSCRKPIVFGQGMLLSWECYLTASTSSVQRKLPNPARDAVRGETQALLSQLRWRVRTSTPVLGCTAEMPFMRISFGQPCPSMVMKGHCQKPCMSAGIGKHTNGTIVLFLHMPQSSLHVLHHATSVGYLTKHGPKMQNLKMSQARTSTLVAGQLTIPPYQMLQNQTFSIGKRDMLATPQTMIMLASV
jgi:hypothetical protein